MTGCIHRFLNQDVYILIMTAENEEEEKKYWKLYEDGKFAYCSKCYKRMNRIYERKKNSGVFIGIGWNCNNCKILCYD
ncbi:MAG: hypothetical protein ACFFDB_00595 [Promethearchaeota archaeon]